MLPYFTVSMYFFTFCLTIIEQKKKDDWTLFDMQKKENDL